MIKIIIAFLGAFAICFFGIKGFRDLSRKDKWALTKLLAYSTICAMLALACLAIIVFIF